VTLPPPISRLARELEAGASAEVAHAHLLEAGAERIGSAYLLGPWSVTSAFQIDAFEASLGRVGALGLGVAPRHVATLRSSDGVAFVIARYALPDESTLLPVEAWPGPYTNAAKDAVIRDLRQLARKGLRHRLAHQGFAHWRAAAPGGQLVLLDWGSVGKPGREQLTEDLADALELVLGLPFHLGTAEGARTLVSTYRRWLQREAGAGEAMESALLGAGCGLEALLWPSALAGEASVIVPDGRWAGTRAHLDPQAPPTAKRGDLWLDPTEACAAVFVGSGWLSLCPLRGWQLLARDELPIDRDAVRGLGSQDDPREAVHGLTATEADALAALLGKTLPPVDAWEAARRALSRRDNLDHDLWSHPEKNWLAPDPGEPPDARPCQLSYGLRRLNPSARRLRAAARTWVPAE